MGGSEGLDGPVGSWVVGWLVVLMGIGGLVGSAVGRVASGVGPV